MLPKNPIAWRRRCGADAAADAFGVWCRSKCTVTGDEQGSHSALVKRSAHLRTQITELGAAPSARFRPAG